MHSSFESMVWTYVTVCTCALVHFMCIAVFRPFTESSLNPQYRLMLLVHLCTLYAPSESILNQLKMLLAL